MKKHIALILFSVLIMQSRSIVCSHEFIRESTLIESAPAKKAQQAAQQKAQAAEIAQLQEAINQRALNDAIAIRSGRTPEKASAPAKPAEKAIHSQSFSSFVTPSRGIKIAAKTSEASTARPKLTIADSPVMLAPENYSPTSEASVYTQNPEELALSSPSFGYFDYGFAPDWPRPATSENRDSLEHLGTPTKTSASEKSSPDSSKSTFSRNPDASTGISHIDSTAYKMIKPESSPFNREISLEQEAAQPKPAQKKPETIFSRVKNALTSQPKLIAAENFAEHYKTLSYKDFAQTYTEKGKPYLYEILGLKNRSSKTEVMKKYNEIFEKNPKLALELQGILNATKSALVDDTKVPTNGEYQLHKYDNSKPIPSYGFQTVTL